MMKRFFPKGNWFQNRIANNVKNKFEQQGRDFNLLMLEQAQSQQKLMPYILFLSLPLFTMMLTLLYENSQYLSDHATFTLYHYILVFGLLGIALIFQSFLKLVGVSSSFIFLPILSITLIHLLFEMKIFYAQGWGKTLLKFFLLTISISILIALLFILVSLITFVI